MAATTTSEAVEHVEKREGRIGTRLTGRGSLNARFVDMGQDRQPIGA